MYNHERILCPDNHSALSEVELMEQYGKYFGSDNWVTFSGRPSITSIKYQGDSINACLIPELKDI